MKLILMVIFLILAASVYAASNEDLKNHIEMHEKMSKAHEKAAKCLKDGKPLDECRAEFRNTCPGNGQGCGMGMGHNEGMGKGRSKRYQKNIN